MKKTGVKVIVQPADSILSGRGLDRNGKVQNYVSRQALLRSKPYTPRHSGALIDSGHVLSGQVVYGVKYAPIVYYGVRLRVHMKFRGGGLRGPYWFDRMKADWGDKILAGAAELCGARVK